MSTYYGHHVDILVDAVAARITFPLRQAVLYPHMALDEIAHPLDNHPDTRHIAAQLPDGTVVCSAAVYRERPSWQDDDSTAWRLRGMATAEAWRSHGIGSRVLGAVLIHVAERGDGLLWCNARLPALAFYKQAGFVARGDRWVDPDTGPHVAVWRMVERSGRRPSSVG